ncbi:hypothetical protein [Streptomyces sp. NPDC001787]|uniref:hypothetical protein n=1 Tax=Streptomyces sp. NPDC001787 TaxID=3154523 RepID=UPI00333186C4
MSPDRTYAAARQLIDPDTDYTVHARSGTGWTQPADPDHQELPGLDILLAARRVLRGEPAGRVWSTRADTLNVRSGNGQVWLRFTVTTTAVTDVCQTPGCAAFLNATGQCTRCSTEAPPADRAPTGLWRVLGLAGSAIAPVSRTDLTTADLLCLACTCLTLDDNYFTLPHPVLPPSTETLLEHLATTVAHFDEDCPGTPNVNEAFPRTELLTLADAALTLDQAHGDPDGLLGHPSVLRPPTSLTPAARTDRPADRSKSASACWLL